MLNSGRPLDTVAAPPTTILTGPSYILLRAESIKDLTERKQGVNRQTLKIQS
jgi:hypothetical protein